MDWANERYVRVFTRKTADHAVLCWQARALWPLIMIAADRCGVIQTKHGARGMAALLDMPRDFVDAGLPELLADGCIREISGGSGYVIPNYIEAQEAVQSDKQRKKDERERRHALAMAAQMGAVTKPDVDVTKRDIESRNVTPESRAVTPRHAESRAVTDGHSVPCRAVPDSTEKNDDARTALAPLASGARARDPSPPVPVPPPDPAPRVTERKAILARVHALHRETYERVRVEVGSDARPMAAIGDPAERALAKHLMELVTLETAEEDCLHVLAVRAAEAVEKRTVKFLGASVWSPDSFPHGLARSVRESDTNPAVGRYEPLPSSAYGVGEQTL